MFKLGLLKPGAKESINVGVQVASKGLSIGLPGGSPPALIPFSQMIRLQIIVGQDQLERLEVKVALQPTKDGAPVLGKLFFLPLPAPHPSAVRPLYESLLPLWTATHSSLGDSLTMGEAAASPKMDPGAYSYAGPGEEQPETPTRRDPSLPDPSDSEAVAAASPLLHTPQPRTGPAPNPQGSMEFVSPPEDANAAPRAEDSGSSDAFRLRPRIRDAGHAARGAGAVPAPAGPGANTPIARPHRAPLAPEPSPLPPSVLSLAAGSDVARTLGESFQAAGEDSPQEPHVGSTPEVAAPAPFSPPIVLAAAHATPPLVTAHSRSRSPSLSTPLPALAPEDSRTDNGFRVYENPAALIATPRHEEGGARADLSTSLAESDVPSPIMAEEVQLPLGAPGQNGAFSFGTTVPTYSGSAHPSPTLQPQPQAHKAREPPRPLPPSGSGPSSPSGLHRPCWILMSPNGKSTASASAGSDLASETSQGSPDPSGSGAVCAALDDRADVISAEAAIMVAEAVMHHSRGASPSRPALEDAPLSISLTGGGAASDTDGEEVVQGGAAMSDNLQGEPPRKPLAPLGVVGGLPPLPPSRLTAEELTLARIAAESLPLLPGLQHHHASSRTGSVAGTDTPYLSAHETSLSGMSEGMGWEDETEPEPAKIGTGGAVAAVGDGDGESATLDDVLDEALGIPAAVARPLGSHSPTRSPVRSPPRPLPYSASLPNAWNRSPARTPPISPAKSLKVGSVMPPWSPAGRAAAQQSPGGGRVTLPAGVMRAASKNTSPAKTDLVRRMDPESGAPHVPYLLGGDSIVLLPTKARGKAGLRPLPEKGRSPSAGAAASQSRPSAAFAPPVGGKAIAPPQRRARPRAASVNVRASLPALPDKDSIKADGYAYYSSSDPEGHEGPLDPQVSRRRLHPTAETGPIQTDAPAPPSPPSPLPYAALTITAEGMTLANTKSKANKLSLPLPSSSIAAAPEPLPAANPNPSQAPAPREPGLEKELRCEKNRTAAAAADLARALLELDFERQSRAPLSDRNRQLQSDNVALKRAAAESVAARVAAERDRDAARRSLVEVQEALARAEKEASGSTESLRREMGEWMNRALGAEAKVGDLSSRLSATEAELAPLKLKLDSAVSDAATHRAAREALGRSLDETAAFEQKVMDEAREFRIMNERLTDKVNHLQAGLEAARAAQLEAAARAQAAEAELAAAKTSMASLKKRLDETSGARGELEGTVAELQASNLSLSAQIEAERREAGALRVASAALSSQNMVLSETATRVAAEADSIREAAGTWQAEAGRAAAAVSELRARLEDRESQCQELASLVRSLERKGREQEGMLGAARKEGEERAAALKEAQAQLQGVEAALAALQSEISTALTREADAIAKEAARADSEHALRAAVQAAEDRAAGIQAELQAVRTTAQARLDAQASQLRSKLAETEAAAGAAAEAAAAAAQGAESLAAELEDERMRLIKSREATAAASAARALLSDRLASLEASCQSLATERDAARAALQAADRQRRELEASGRSLLERLDGVETLAAHEVSRLTATLQQREAELAAMRSELGRRDGEWEAMQAEVKLLQSNMEALLGLQLGSGPGRKERAPQAMASAPLPMPLSYYATPEGSMSSGGGGGRGSSDAQRAARTAGHLGHPHPAAAELGARLFHSPELRPTGAPQFPASASISVSASHSRGDKENSGRPRTGPGSAQRSPAEVASRLRWETTEASLTPQEAASVFFGGGGGGAWSATGRTPPLRVHEDEEILRRDRTPTPKYDTDFSPALRVADPNSSKSPTPQPVLSQQKAGGFKEQPQRDLPLTSPGWALPPQDSSASLITPFQPRIVPPLSPVRRALQSGGKMVDPFSAGGAVSDFQGHPAAAQGRTPRGGEGVSVRVSFHRDATGSLEATPYSVQGFDSEAVGSVAAKLGAMAAGEADYAAHAHGHSSISAAAVSAALGRLRGGGRGRTSAEEAFISGAADFDFM